MSCCARIRPPRLPSSRICSSDTSSSTTASTPRWPPVHCRGSAATGNSDAALDHGVRSMRPRARGGRHRCRRDRGAPGPDPLPPGRLPPRGGNPRGRVRGPVQSVRDEHAPRVHCARAAQWPGIDVLREELGEDEFEALRDAGSGLTSRRPSHSSTTPCERRGRRNRLAGNGTSRLRGRTWCIRRGCGARRVRRCRPDGGCQLSGSVRGTAAGPAAAAGVVPIENVVNGTVRENYDLLLEHELEIVGEVVVPVRLSPRGAARPAPRRDRAGLLPHPGARPGRGVPADAAVAAPDHLQHRRCRQIHRRARRTGERPCCRRGPLPCSDSRSSRTTSRTLPTTGHGSSSSRHPSRTFRWPSRRPPADDARLAVRNRPGTLLAVLEVFARHGLNMSKLESAEPRTRLGVRLLGRSRRAWDGPRDAGGHGRARRRRRCCGFSAATRAARAADTLAPRQRRLDR